MISPMNDLELSEMKIRRVESGRILLAIPGFSDEFFDTRDDLLDRMEMIIAGGQFADGMIIDDESERGLDRSRRVNLCGSLAGPMGIGK